MMTHKGGRGEEIERSYAGLLGGLVDLLEQARRSSARSVNSIMTAAYWEIGRRIVEHEQEGKTRAAYGEALMERLASDLTGQVWEGLLAPQSLPNARVLYRLANCADAVCAIKALGHKATSGKSADTVRTIGSASSGGCRRPDTG